MKKFEVWFKDGRIEVVEGEDKIQDMILSLENFDREDVDYIYELDDEGEHKKEVWNDWEGIIRDVDDDLAFDDYKEWDLKDATIDDFYDAIHAFIHDGDCPELSQEDIDGYVEAGWQDFVDNGKVENPADIIYNMLVVDNLWDPFDTDWD